MVDLGDLAQATPYVKLAAPAVMQGIGRSLGWGAEKVREVFTSTFEDHLEHSKRRCSYVRTLINPDFNTSLRDIYVNLYLSHGNLIVRDEDLLSHMSDHKRIIITGTAGAGKSMVMRSLVLQSLGDSIEEVPIFVDLRDLADPSKIAILDSIFALVTPESQRQNKSIFDKAVEKYSFCFFLDGLDEVSPELRLELRKQVDQLIVRFPNIKIVISSRPDVDFVGWDEFSIFHLLPVNIDQSRMIIEKCDYPDQALKEEFLSKLGAGEFKEFSSFLNVPLLNVILLMCYGEFLYLSESSSSFYDQAFEVLYRRHDRTKNLKRKHFSELSYEQFRKILDAFCYRSLVDGAVSFTEQELTGYLAKASKIAEIPVDTTALSQDMTESVSLMQRDGLKIFFIHRTFQEYFAARFIISYKEKEIFRVYDSIVRNGMSQSVITMAAEMDMRSLEREWVCPSLKAAVEALDEAPHDPMAFIRKAYMSFGVYFEKEAPAIFGGFSWGHYQLSSTIRLLNQLYPDLIHSDRYLFDGPVFVDGEPLNDYLLSGTGVHADQLRNTSSTPNGEGTAFLFNTANGGWEWLSLTDVPNKALELEAQIRSLYDIVCSRVEQRAKESVFD